MKPNSKRIKSKYIEPGRQDLVYVDVLLGFKNKTLIYKKVTFHTYCGDVGKGGSEGGEIFDGKHKQTPF